TSVEIFSRVMHNFLIPEDEIQQFTEIVRADNYELFKNKKRLPKTFRPSNLPEFDITCLKVGRDSGGVIGKSLAQLNLRAKFGVSILAIKRKEETIEHIDASEKLLRGDLVFVNGSPEKIEKFHRMIE